MRYLQTELDLAYIQHPGNLSELFGVGIRDEVLDTSQYQFREPNPGEVYYEVALIEPIPGGRLIYVDFIMGNHESSEPSLIGGKHVEFNNGGVSIIITPDKDFNTEPMSNITMYDGQTYSLWVKDEATPSRVVNGLKMVHNGQTYGFYVVFKRKKWEGETPPPNGEDEMLEAAFTAEPTEAVIPFTLKLTNYSKGNINKYEWWYGPDIVSNDRDTTILIDQPGLFNIGLTIYDEAGVKDEASIEITALQPSDEPIGLIEHVNHEAGARGNIPGLSPIYVSSDSAWFGHVDLIFETDLLLPHVLKAQAENRTHLTFALRIDKVSDIATRYLDATEKE